MARELVRRTLAEAARERWTDQAELAVTEVVSNAVLHAHTTMQVVVAVRSDHVHIEVTDHNPLLPAPRSYDHTATTGRGLGLVALLTTDCGVTPVSGGKTVWFTIDDDDPTSEWDDLTEEWATSPTTEQPHRDERHNIILPGLPVTLWLAAQQHHDSLIREYTLQQAVTDRTTSDTINAADTAETLLATAVSQAIEAALAAGAPIQTLPTGHPSPLPSVPARLDVHLALPEEAGEKFTALQDTLDTAEELAQTGMLLSRPALPEIVAVRDWCCEQVIAQLRGVAPTPWDEAESQRRQADPYGETEPWDTTAIETAQEGVVAADDSNRIIAVSKPLADLLGWDRDDLVGRRIVVLIPPRLREMHVAGFTRHLTTGESHVIGVPIELPVLKADGNEVTCKFMIERAQGTGRRSIYIAWISPANV